MGGGSSRQDVRITSSLKQGETLASNTSYCENGTVHLQLSISTRSNMNYQEDVPTTIGTISDAQFRPMSTRTMPDGAVFDGSNDIDADVTVTSSGEIRITKRGFAYDEAVTLRIDCSYTI